jgi:Fur family ferric uptake transcriptional regulator
LQRYTKNNTKLSYSTQKIFFLARLKVRILSGLQKKKSNWQEKLVGFFLFIKKNCIFVNWIIMRNLENSCSFEEYVQCFYAFLDERKLKRSSERNSILRTAFDFNRHFTAEELQCRLQEQKFHVSRSTLYATLGLLMDAGLLFKHHLPGRVTPLYEKFYCTDVHNHIFIEGDEKMIEFGDKRIEEIKKEIAEKYDIDVVKHTFTIYCKNK